MNPIDGVRRFIAQLRGVDYRSVYLRGVVDEQGDGTAYAQLLSNAILYAWKGSSNYDPPPETRD